MAVKQSTIGEILDSERLMVVTAPEQYGAYYENAIECSIFFTNFLKSIDSDRFVFARFLSQIKKHHTLALFSTVRLHQIQATMNLRQVLEAGAFAAFAIANPDPNHFVSLSKQGLLNQSQKLTGKIYAWLDKEFPAGSKVIKDIKKLINDSTAHANLVNSERTFQLHEAENWISSPFFDIDEPYFVKTDLWRVANIALAILDLFFSVNKPLNVIKFADDFTSRFEKLANQNNVLCSEMMSGDRYKKAMLAASRLSPTIK